MCWRKPVAHILHGVVSCILHKLMLKAKSTNRQRLKAKEVIDSEALGLVTHHSERLKSIMHDRK